ncbi:hypothetical protein KL906_003549 [Ogataea polymorpha]|uniref:Uncharacterized protein n=1 Tax=Ogataea polymorpha TaxID=460523 RepID=A0A9P8NSD1_9ASCO|nr:hypothetical protein KL906_003549 [Ogataea polymorpha]KAG7916715.1 hypothetical protein KL927_003354 [Ogataea polymorpha]KAH3659068.1 hypothetical protein OGATHE_006794 [Ogataea polymorpha]
MRANIAKQTVLITGASSGIGLETARALADEANGDIKLILTARRVEKLDEAKKELESKYEAIKVYTASLDVSKPQLIKDFVKSIPEEFADIDILVNNAGLALGRDPVGTIDIADVQAMLDTNVLGLITLTQEIVPRMIKRNKGDIVNVGSIAGRNPYPGGAIYCSTKAAVKFFTRSLRKELADTRIRVIEVAPGAVKTEFSIVRYKGDQEKADEVYKDKDPLIAQDIADFIVYACTRRKTAVIAEAVIFPSYQA